MRRLAGILTALAFAASLSAGAVAKPHEHDQMSNTMMMGHGKRHTCPPGQHWVKGHHRKNGQKVRGYCR